MTMSFFSFKKKKSQKYLVVGLETSHIRTCFVELDKNEKPFILAQDVQKVSGENNMRNTTKALDLSLVSLFKKNPINVDSVICVLGGSLYKSYTNIYVKDEDTPFSFNGRNMKRISEEIFSDMSKEAETDFNLDKSNITFLEKHILHISINGYEVQSIKRENPRKIEISFFGSFANSEVLKIVESTIHRYVRRRVVFQSSSLVQTIVARDTFQYLDDFTLVNVEDEHTEVSVISNGSFVYKNSFELGSNVFDVKALSLGFNPLVLRSELSAFLKGLLDKEKTPGLVKVIPLAQEEWRRKFYTSLQEIIHTLPLSKHVVVISRQSSFFWLKKAIEDVRNKHLSISEVSLHAIMVNAEALQSLVGSKIVDPDIKLMIYTAFTKLKVRN